MVVVKVRLFVAVGFVFFFQAEDGIRDYKVTGVQTCALPISGGDRVGRQGFPSAGGPVRRAPQPRPWRSGGGGRTLGGRIECDGTAGRGPAKIGRASCRGRVEISVVAGSFKKKKKDIDERVCT